MFNKTVKSIQSFCLNNTKVSPFNQLAQTTQKSLIKSTKQTNVFNHFCSKFESYNTKVKSIQSICSNNTKVESFNVQHKKWFYIKSSLFNHFAQKSSNLMYNKKVSLFNRLAQTTQKDESLNDQHKTPFKQFA
jgi:hypothetical protein